jgi:hypothetical protein
MQDPKDPIPQASRREPWNKGILIGTSESSRPMRAVAPFSGPRRRTAPCVIRRGLVVDDPTIGDGAFSA